MTALGPFALYWPSTPFALPPFSLSTLAVISRTMSPDCRKLSAERVTPEATPEAEAFGTPASALSSPPFRCTLMKSRTKSGMCDPCLADDAGKAFDGEAAGEQCLGPARFGIVAQIEQRQPRLQNSLMMRIAGRARESRWQEESIWAQHRRPRGEV